MRYKPRKPAATDEEVVSFLKQHLDRNLNVGWTVLLRKFREGGKGCDSDRFRRLHAELTAPTPAER